MKKEVVAMNLHKPLQILILGLGLESISSIGLCIAIFVALMLLIILILILIAFKPWRFLRSSIRSNHNSLKDEDLERHLVSDDLVDDQSSESARNCDLEASRFNSPRSEGLVHKQRLHSSSPLRGSVVLDVIPDAAEDAQFGRTLKHSLVTNVSFRDHLLAQRDLIITPKSGLHSDKTQEFLPQEGIRDQRSCLTLEVISGPSQGLCYFIRSTDTSKLPLTLGRVPSSDLQLKDSEVSGKHAMINWNLNKVKWELVDMGSLNGTLLNSQSVSHPDTGSRHWGDPVDLTNGDMITLGSTSTVYVQIISQSECHVPFGVGMASDPMALRHGGKKLPMEDVCYYQWPLPGHEEFGVFGICDGHAGDGAAKSASKIIPEMVATILSESNNRERVLSLCDAADVLQNVFSRTEERINHYYEGCTATVLLIWTDSGDNFFAQCANVGDSACILNVDEKLLKMTEDHRVTSHSERQRINETGERLKDGEERLCGLNLARMLGDKYLKEQDVRFSSEPYISPVVPIDRSSKAFALMASDGFWDVISAKKAIQLVLQTRDRYITDGGNSAEKIATFLLNEARKLRTKDNTSIIYMDFATTPNISSAGVNS